MDIHIGRYGPSLDESADRLRRLGHPLRLALLELLGERTELCVCMMTATLDVAQATLSRHLRILRDAHLVRARREGPNVYYSVNERTLTEVSDAIARLSAPVGAGKESRQ